MKTVPLFGLDFISARMDELCEVLAERGSEADARCLVVTPNVEHVVKYERMQRHDPALFELITGKALVLPDGQPIVWASRLLGRPLVERLAGSDLFPLLIRRLVARRRKIYLIGAEEEVLTGVVRTVGSPDLFRWYAPPLFILDDRDEVTDRLTRDVLEFCPDAVFVGLGFPKQERVSLDMASAMEKAGLPVPTFYCLGASLEFFTGKKRRAPAIFRKTGFEWAFRLLQEPRRLWKRYLYSFPVFLLLLARELRSRRGWPQCRVN